MPSGLVRVSADAGHPGVIAQQPCGVGHAGDRHAVLRLGVVHAVPTADVAAGVPGHGQAATQNLGGELERQHVTRPAEQIDRDHRAPAHRIDVRERIGGCDAAPVEGVVHHGGEEVGRGDDGEPIGDPDHGRVVAGIEADQQFGAAVAGGREALGRDQPGQDALELPRGDLACAPAAMGVLGKAYGLELGQFSESLVIDAMQLGSYALLLVHPQPVADGYALMTFRWSLGVAVMLVSGLVSALTADYVRRRPGAVGRGALGCRSRCGRGVELRLRPSSSDSTSAAGKTVWAWVKYIGVCALPPAWLVFALQYTGRERRVTRRLIAGLASCPCASCLFSPCRPQPSSYGSIRRVHSIPIPWSALGPPSGCCSVIPWPSPSSAPG